MKILLVDDDAFLRDMYAKKFSASGDQIDSADSGAAALQKIRQEDVYDVVLLDMVMPGITGVELIAALFEHAPEPHPAIVVLSNQGQQEDIEAAAAAGAKGYIVKAETVPSDVVKMVHDIVSKK